MSDHIPIWSDISNSWSDIIYIYVYYSQILELSQAQNPRRIAWQLHASTVACRKAGKLKGWGQGETGMRLMYTYTAVITYSRFNAHSSNNPSVLYQTPHCRPYDKFFVRPVKMSDQNEIWPDIYTKCPDTMYTVTATTVQPKLINRMLVRH